MKSRLLIILGCLGLIVIGVYLNFEYYQDTIQPLNLIENNLNKIIDTSDEILILNYLSEIKLELHLIMEYLPEDKNPVWFFPTESTNFLRIENNVNGMITMTEKISTVPKDSSVYHTGMMNINDIAEIIRENIADATGFLYGSALNIFFTLIWVYGIIGLAIMWIRK